MLSIMTRASGLNLSGGQVNMITPVISITAVYEHTSIYTYISTAEIRI